MHRLSAFCLLALGLAAGPALAQDGLLDSSFGIFGTGRNVIAHDLGGGNADTLADVVTDAQGRLYLVATAHAAGSQRRIAVTRLTAGGLLDESFGAGGSIHSGEASVTAQRARLDASGNLVVLGTRRIGDSADTDFYVCRYDSQGNPVPFAVTGQCVSIAFDVGVGTWVDVPADLLIDAQGRIVVVGTAGIASNLARGAMARVLPDGALDPAFGTNGKATFDFGDGALTRFTALAPMSGGRYVVVGERGDPAAENGTSALFARIGATGAPDPAFMSGQGYGGLSFNLGSPFHRNEAAVAVLPLANDAMLVVGNADIADGGGRQAAFLTRIPYANFIADDSAFGNGGRVVVAGGHDLEVNRALVQSDGRIVLVGTHQATATFALDLAVLRLLPHGAMDPSFGQSGRTHLDFVLPGELDFGLGVTLQNGRPVAAGSSLRAGPQNFDLTVARLVNDRIFTSPLE